MYSFAQRSDCTVIDEPFYPYFLAQTGAKRPDREITLSSMTPNIDEAKAMLVEESEHLFVKNMAAHFLELDYYFLLSHYNIIYIRHPARILASYSKVIEEPTMQDIGLQYQWEIVQYLQANNGRFIVLDSTDLLGNPELVLQKLCVFLDVEFQHSMLNWPKGKKDYDGPWWPYWYGNLHKSSGFRKQKSSEDIPPEHLHLLLEESLPFYNRLEELKLQ